jgi:iron(III) transport system permease protein
VLALDPFWQSVLLNTLLMVLGVCLLSTLIALPLSFFLERYELPGRERFFRLFSLPYVFPSYILAISWIILVNPSVGWLQGFSPVTLNIYSLVGIIFVESSVLMSILFLNLRSALERVDPAMEEAARLAGSSWQSFRHITFPLIKKSFAGAIISIALASFASFGVPAMLGQAGKVYVLTTAIYSMIKTGSETSFDEALWVSLLAAIPTLILALLVRRWERSRTQSLASSKTSRQQRRPIGGLRKFLILTWAGLLLLVLVALPVFTLIFASFQKSLSGFSLRDLSLHSWEYVFLKLPQFWQSFGHSISLALTSTVLLLALSLALSLWQRRAQRNQQKSVLRFLGFFESLAFFLYSTPGTVLALLLIVVSNYLGLASFQGSLSLIVVAYCLKYASLSWKSLNPAFAYIHPSLGEAAQLSGARSLQRLRYVYWPLLRTAIVATATLIFMPTLSELTMTLLLYGPESSTLGVLLFELQEYADRSSAAVLGTLILLFVFLLQKITQRRSYEAPRS